MIQDHRRRAEGACPRTRAISRTRAGAAALALTGGGATIATSAAAAAATAAAAAAPADSARVRGTQGMPAANLEREMARELRVPASAPMAVPS